MRQPVVLIISGNQPQTMLICRNLQDGGYQVSVAERGAQVPGLLVQVQPQLVLLDWDLSDRSALAVLREIRSQRGFTRLPVILLAREISCENKILSLEAGVDFCLEGVIYPKEFVARVRALLRRTVFTLNSD